MVGKRRQICPISPLTPGKLHYFFPCLCISVCTYPLIILAFGRGSGVLHAGMLEFSIVSRNAPSCHADFTFQEIRASTRAQGGRISQEQRFPAHCCMHVIVETSCKSFASMPNGSFLLCLLARSRVIVPGEQSWFQQLPMGGVCSSLRSKHPPVFVNSVPWLSIRLQRWCAQAARCPSCCCPPLPTALQSSPHLSHQRIRVLLVLCLAPAVFSSGHACCNRK